jgi:1-acyl-sn-glycerol-3-phosphate acyltransferase
MIADMVVLIRAGWRLFLVGLLLTGGALCVALVYPWVGFANRAAIKQSWSAALVAALGIRLAPDTALDRALTGLIVANHISFVDIFVIDAVLGTTFVSKHEVANWPLIGWLTARTDNLFIERGSRNAAYATQQRMADVLAAGRRLVVFPEGTTTRGDRVLPFHAALLQSAVVSGVPVICLALCYRDAAGKTTPAPAYVDEDSLWDCLWRIASQERIVAEVWFAGSLPGAATDRRHLAHQAHQHIARAARCNCNADVTSPQ